MAALAAPWRLSPLSHTPPPPSHRHLLWRHRARRLPLLLARALARRAPRHGQPKLPHLLRAPRRRSRGGARQARPLERTRCALPHARILGDPRRRRLCRAPRRSAGAPLYPPSPLRPPRNLRRRLTAALLPSNCASTSPRSPRRDVESARPPLRTPPDPFRRRRRASSSTSSRRSSRPSCASATSPSLRRTTARRRWARW